MMDRASQFALGNFLQHLIPRPRMAIRQVELFRVWVYVVSLKVFIRATNYALAAKQRVNFCHAPVISFFCVLPHIRTAFFNIADRHLVDLPGFEPGSLG